MGFDLLSFIAMFLGGINTEDVKAKIDEWTATEGAKYPDAQERIAAMRDWLVGVIVEAQPNLTAEGIKATVLEIATAIINGTSGVDPAAGHGGA